MRDYINRVPDYGEKKKPHNLSLTDTAWERLDKLAALLGVSRSEFVERLSRGAIAPQDLQAFYKIFLKKG
ncbi:hypothetical protein PaVLD_ORF023R [Planktothrix phage PaV-LD]|jgi:Ribbon-helix-helix protein, copG family|uniref:hypothetical protein n=1 Tax=Planktothrix phage PaV-LD TaxID=994601 RepID=UPI000243C89C|nr:hypothetical protein PaVLD_ORF023R [Planktothrix phage PaV-LD]ADZ31530.1 hypothetical protein PaVLD_ORF023R [Planktothrix phage PaV-LD]